ncbi:MAG: energy-coupled thiamine transporter ThiT [Nitrososphaerota archaeon]|uniref:energy-coupled thiamine transporter ThiT n=1 Tax=Candidatus Bathycorpusculum sp. TaxID=2994959 RepID=UPI00283243F7|nr:energy-coupled thiamine transporter ThiT [Candidatus Termiticorpusculum sp.]MCL2257918.1 energy-coupled thiamine transporter ThiT [Candidatus Termiticorpusculum sp.]MCL2291943.1 energy-coupled thiamine transporter ThiT [Candidatus Termiticorpusculum sp.]MDR0460700.1 energy-coupled thiamine transporter ThiT [Nitrososphaerota archaeon]
MSTINQNKPKKNSYKDPTILAEVAIFTALSTALSIYPIWKMPQGGSITLLSMLPLLLLAQRRGPKIGIFAGVIYGLVQLAISPEIYYPTQVLLDYPLAYGCLGLAGFFKSNPIIGAIVAVTGRFSMHLISGAVFFAEFVPVGVNPWIYSTIYNGSYLFVEFLLICLALILLKGSLILIRRMGIRDYGQIG